MIQISEPKTEMPIISLNSSSSITNCTRRIKFSNLKVSVHAVAAPKDSYRIPTLYLFIYLSKYLYGDKNSKIN